MLKIRGTEIMQRISELQVDFSIRAIAYRHNDGQVARATSAYLNLRKLSIRRLNENQRNIIAHMILGL